MILILSLLGYDAEDVANKFSKYIDVKEPNENHVENLTNQFAGLNRVIISSRKILIRHL